MIGNREQVGLDVVLKQDRVAVPVVVCCNDCVQGWAVWERKLASFKAANSLLAGDLDVGVALTCQARVQPAGAGFGCDLKDLLTQRVGCRLLAAQLVRQVGWDLVRSDVFKPDGVLAISDVYGEVHRSCFCERFLGWVVDGDPVSNVAQSLGRTVHLLDRSEQVAAEAGCAHVAGSAFDTVGDQWQHTGICGETGHRLEAVIGHLAEFGQVKSSLATYERNAL